MARSSSLARGVSYADALVILDPENTQVSKLAEALTEGTLDTLLTANLGLLDVVGLKRPLIDWAKGRVSSLAKSLAGKDRLRRIQRIEAAHAVIVVLAFQEAVAEIDWRLIDSDPSPAETRTGTLTGPLKDAVSRGITPLMSNELPLPRVTVPIEALRSELGELYREAWLALRQALAFSEYDVSVGDIPASALARYEEYQARLALEIPEFGYWLTGIDSQATRQLVTSTAEMARAMHAETQAALGQLRGLLEVIGKSAIKDDLVSRLCAGHRQRVQRPALNLTGVTDELSMPSMESLYVNPACRVARDTLWNRTPVSDKAWEKEYSTTDVQTFLAGFLTSSDATGGPLCIWGAPGAGKSTFAHMIAARLPEPQYVALIVNLRSVPADASVRNQIDRAVSDVYPGGWRALSHASSVGLPVVILEGMDEMLQASQISRPGYIEEVAQFQSDELDFGYPCAVMITSRVSSANLVRIPRGCSSLYIQPFDEARIREWVHRWNTYLSLDTASRKLEIQNVLNHRNLAEQPLLLLLLAIFDLQTEGISSLSGAATASRVYERVLHHYATREVRRIETSREPEASRVESMLRSWGAIACVMVNRGRAQISQDVLIEDMIMLGAADSADHAVRLIGSFYFGFSSSATVGSGSIKTFVEFLHDSMADFLWARTFLDTLQEYAEEQDFLRNRSSPRSADGTLVKAYGGFKVISDRPLMLQSIREIIEDKYDAIVRQQLAGAGSRLRSILLKGDVEWSHRGYNPLSISYVTIISTLTLNLVLTELALSGPLIIVDRDQGYLSNAYTEFHRLLRLWGASLNSTTLARFASVVRVRKTTTFETDADGGRYFGLYGLSLVWEDGSNVRVFDCVYPDVPRYFDLYEYDDPDVMLNDPLEIPSMSRTGMDLRLLALRTPSSLEESYIQLIRPVWDALDQQDRDLVNDYTAGILAAFRELGPRQRLQCLVRAASRDGAERAQVTLALLYHLKAALDSQAHGLLPVIVDTLLTLDPRLVGKQLAQLAESHRLTELIDRRLDRLVDMRYESGEAMENPDALDDVFALKEVLHGVDP
jgi:hypothetical protein